MLAYYFVFALSWIAAFFDYIGGVKKAYLASILVFFVFLINRYQTGYDWIAYLLLYENVNGLFDGDFTKLISTSVLHQKELMFVFFMSILKTITDDFQFVIFVVTIVEVYALHKFLVATTRYKAVVLAIVVSWLMLTLYFSVMRQGMGVSLYLLFLIFYFSKKYKQAIVVGVLSVGMQYSVIAYYAVFLLAKKTITKKMFMVLFSSVLVYSVVSFGDSKWIFRLLSQVPSEFIAEKAKWYEENREWSVSGFDVFYVYAYSFVMAPVLLRAWPDDNAFTIYKVMHTFALIFVLVQLAFIDLPLIRNRFMYVGFLMQFVIVVNLYAARQMISRMVVFSLMFAASLSYYGLFLNKDSSLPFIPYQSYLKHIVTGDEGDGMERTEILLNKQFGR